MKFARLALLAAAGTLATTAALAQATQGPRLVPTQGAISVMPFGGTDFTIGGTATKAASQSVAAAGTVRFGGSTITFNVAGSATIEAKKFSDVYNAPIVLGVSGAYGLVDGGEVFGSFRFLHAEGKSTSGITYSAAGTINGTAFNGGVTSTMKASNYTSFGLDAGYRHFFRMGDGFTPYLGAFGGLTRVNAINVTETLSGVSATARIYDASITPALGLQVGVTYAVGPAMALGLETGLRYDFRLKGQDSGLSAGFRDVNNAGDRVSIPLQVTGRFAF